MNSHEKGKDGEQFVLDVATNSFLSYWCYPNPKDELGDKKELCDLLILFNDTLILFCVKNYEFKGFYDRYFRKTIEKDVSQLYGAERKILNSSRDILIKTKDGREETIKRAEIKNTYRVIVHLGEKVHYYPFNKTTKQEAFVNVFDKKSFYNIINWLDTIKDFREYLQKREEAFGDKDVLIMPSEEHEFDENTGRQFFQHNLERKRDKREILLSGTESDLLASYLKNGRQFPSHIFSEEYTDMLLQLDGGWNEFNEREEVKNKKQADSVSYFIDEFVKREILPIASPDNIECAKELLSFSRFDRRVISKNLFDFVKTYNDKRGFFIARRFGEIDGIGIITVFYTVDMTEEQVNTLLPIVIDTYNVHIKYKHSKIILIATTTDFKQFKTCVEKNIVPFDKETEELVIRNMKALKWFENTTEIPFSEKEYPDVKA